MKKLILPLAISILVFSCAEEKPKEETPVEPNGINISVNDDSTNANISINGEGINVKSADGKDRRTVPPCDQPRKTYQCA